MAKSALKKKNGKGGNGDVIPLRPTQRILEDGFEKNLSERRNTEVDRILESISEMSIEELKEMTIYSQYKRLRKRALELLPRELGLMRSIHFETSYQDIADATKHIIDELQGKSA